MLVGSIALVLSAMSYQQATTWKNSATLWDNAIEACPSSKAYTNRAIIYRKQKDLKTALEYTNKALGINALDPEVLGARGNIYFDLQQYDKAIDDLSKSIEISPTNANFFNSRGAVYATVGKNELALADFNQAIKIDPFGPENYTNRALLYKSMNNNTAAIADYKTYLEKFNQNDFGIWNDIGACYYNNKEFNKAIESFNKAASLSPNNGQTFFNLSKVYLAMGDKANALSNAQIAQQKGEHIPPEYLQLIQ